ncbi:sulfonate ABC transporter substrate-binding protein [Sphaerisporangium krabiense]|uniref:NitT/TauT family transport system substrate-binding protein n=1 Tax=Sphaerisporangium krabiense TaxID=763782 RepID=A0A7W9DS02_9ACTN|nr:ABC transporter substrate-binding protein [Sphaerisporangium krabiense]MBB5627895.1 NitT/TauT family transport system substrate-binding protein [Sphaerisporangium krabiense]GII62053.1 sulfonate ABC transporter substrate-binding protein [Sphaerisporangium krabiense]
MRRSARICLAVVLLISAAACGSSGDGPASGGGAGKAGGKDKVTAGVIAIVDTAPIHLGKAKGFFDKQNIDLTITPVQGGAASVSGTVGGQFQFAFGNVTSLLTAAERGLPLKVVGNGVSSTGEQGKDFSAVLVKADSPIKSAKDLVGKRVSVNQQQNIGDTTIRASVRKAGGDPSKVEFVELPFPDAPAALQAGRVDAIWVVEPFLSQAVAQGARPIAWNFADAAPNLTVAMYFTTTKTDPGLVTRFRAAMDESLRYADTHPDEVRDILKTYTKIDPGVLAKMNLPRWPTQINRASVEAVAKAALGDGVLKREPNVGALLPAS